MTERKFKIGQVVYFRPKRSSAPLSAFVGTLPDHEAAACNGGRVSVRD
jgi:hypothetical protein